MEITRITGSNKSGSKSPFRRLAPRKTSKKYRKHIPKELRRAASKKKLSLETIKKFDYTDFLRLILYSNRARHFARDNLRIRGLPLRLPYKLKDYQIHVLNWMRQKEALNPKETYNIRGGIVCLKMGLGKTLLTLAHILTQPKGKFPTLVVASKTVLYEWRSQIRKFFDDEDVRVLYVHKDILKKSIDNLTQKVFQKYDIVVTTYDVCLHVAKKYDIFSDVEVYGEEGTLHENKVISISERTYKQSNDSEKVGIEALLYTPWERIVCDESQRFCNPKTRVYRAIMCLYGRYKWCLSGTPIRNYDTDIWAQFRFLGYNGITERMQWKRQQAVVYQKHNLPNHVIKMDNADADIVLPPLSVMRQELSLNKKEQEVYDYILTKTRKAYDLMLERVCSFSCVLAIFTRLRQCCISPYIMTPSAKRTRIGKLAMKKLIDEDLLKADEMYKALLKQPRKTKRGRTNQKDTHENDLALLKELNKGLGKWIYNKEEAGFGATKIQAVMNVIQTIPKGEKIIVFSMFSTCLDLIADYIDEKNDKIKYIQVDGSVNGRDRALKFDQYRTDPSITLLLMTYKVGSEGLNFTEANHIICVEAWWTPVVRNQAIGRAYRYGQTKPVEVHDIFMKGTIESKIEQLCEEKNYMANAFLEGAVYKMRAHSGLDIYSLGQILGTRDTLL